MVNHGKSFRHGFFRESCGVDAYHGVSVTPYRIKEHDASSVSGAVSMCDLAKRLVINGYVETAAAIYKEVRRYWKLHLCNDPDAQGIFEYVSGDLLFFARNEPSLRWNISLQRWEVKILRVRPLIERLTRHDWYHVVDSLNRLESPINENAARFEADIDKDVFKNTLLSRQLGGLEYAVPYRTRPETGWTALLLR
jgi:hypothetical protein